MQSVIIYTSTIYEYMEEYTHISSYDIYIYIYIYIIHVYITYVFLTHTFIYIYIYIYILIRIMEYTTMTIIKIITTFYNIVIVAETTSDVI